MGSSEDDAGNFKTEGVGSEQDCYSLCLYRNGGHCFSFSYAPVLGTCIIPHAVASTHLDEISNTTNADYNTTFFTNYVSANNPLSGALHVILTDVIYYKGDNLDPVNLHSTGVQSEQDCYTLCLARNGGDCFSFSYSHNLKECVLPEEDGTTHLKDMKKSSDNDFTTYILNGYSETSLPTADYITLEGVIFYMGSSKMNSNFNFYTEGVASEQNCYALCLQRNDGRCFAFNYNASTGDCRVPKDEGSTDISNILYTTASGYNTSVNTAYKSSLLSAVNYVALSNVSYSKDTNYEISGPASRQDCYIICLMKNGNKCFSFSFTASTTVCSFPLEDGSLTLDDVNNTAAVGTDTIIFTDYVASNNNIYSALHVVVTDQIYYKSTLENTVNYQTTGVESVQDCYTLCLYRNDGQCFSVSYSASSKECVIPQETGTTTLKSMKKTGGDSDTYVFSDYADRSLPSPDYITLQDVILFRGSSKSNNNFNFYTYGVTSEENCYALCLHSNGGNCIAFNYSPSKEECRCPKDDGLTVFNDLKYTTGNTFNSTLTTTYIGSQLSGVNYVILTNMSYSEGTNYQITGPTSRQDCYIICLMRNDNNCFSISFTHSTTVCTFPLEDGNLHLDDITQTTEDSTDTLVFTDYTQTDLTLQNHITLSEIIYHKGSSEDDAGNFKTEGVGSKQDCYSVCLYRNGGHCFSFSYAPVLGTCIVPHAVSSTHLDEISNTTNADYSTTFFTNYVSGNNPLSGALHVILTDIIYYKGDDLDPVNFQSTGVESEQDCYTLCLARNGGDCFSFSYSAATKECLAPYEDGTTHLDNVQRVTSDDWSTYLLNDYASSYLTSVYYVTLTDVIYSKDTNYIMYGATSQQDCYTLCLMRNDNKCFSFSFNSSSNLCSFPLEDGNVHLDDITKTTEAGTNTIMFTDYTQNNILLQSRISLSGVIYHKASGRNNINFNFISEGVGSDQDCYALCLQRSGGYCVSLSYSSTSKTCRAPRDDGSTVITDLNNATDTNYITTLFTDYTSYALTSAYYVTLTDVIYSKDTNYIMYGATSQQDCYTLCLMRNDNKCFSFSFASSSTMCSFPLEDGNLHLDDITKTASGGSDTIIFTDYTQTSLLSQTRVTLDDVIYYKGDDVNSDSNHFITDGVISDQNCYVLCLERNGGHCFSFSYSSTLKTCRAPRDDGSTVITDLNNATDSDYITTLFTGYASYSLTSVYYVTLTDVIYSKDTNYIMYGATTQQDCYTLCLIRNDNKCFSFSHDSTALVCTFPLDDGNVILDDISQTSAADYTTTVLTGVYSTSTALSSNYYITLTAVTLHKGTDSSDSYSNFITEKVASQQDCYTLCLLRNGGSCFSTSYSSVSGLCIAPHDSGNTAVSDLVQMSDSDSSSVVMAAAHTDSLSSMNYMTLSGAIYHRSTSIDDLNNNFKLAGVSSNQDCYTACLLYNGGNCATYSRGTSDSLCIIPIYDGTMAIGDYTQQNTAYYETVYFTTGYTGTMPSGYVTWLRVKLSKSNGENVELAGVTSVSNCYTSCLIENSGYCYSFSHSTSPYTCHFPRDSGTTQFSNITTYDDTTFTSYMLPRSPYDVELSQQTYFSLTNRILYYGTGYADSDNNYLIEGVPTSNDCFKMALAVNSGDKIAFSHSTSYETCYIPHYQAGDYDIESLGESAVSNYIAVVFKGAHTASIPSHISISNYIYYKGSSYSETANNYKLTGVTSAQDCYTACLMRNDGQCFSFSHYSDTCYVPIISGTLGIDDLQSVYVSYYTTYVMSSYGMLSSGSYMTATNMVYYAGTSYTDGIQNLIRHVDDYVDCAVLCYMVNNGRCVAFSYGASTCIVPYDSGTLMASSLSKTSYSGYTSYLIVQTSSGDTLSLTGYSYIPSQYMYLGTSMDDTTYNIKLTSVVSSAQDCYRLCYTYYETNCQLFTYGSGVCSFPHQSTAIQYVTDVKVGSSGSYNAYYMFSTSSRTESFPSSSYSYISNLRIRDGQSEHIYELTFSGVVDVHACYRLCLQTMSNCNTFSYNPNTDYCYLTTVNFHSEWTYVESISGCTGYFAKNSGSWKLITKHREYGNVMPDDAFNNGGGYYQVVSAGDMAYSSSYSSYGYLKNQMIDYWTSLSSKYKVRMELRSSSGTLLKYMEYNAGDTTSTNWFSSGKFVSSSWSDLHSGVTHNAWSMGSSHRTFFINHSGGTCTTDAGWIQISATANYACTQWDYSSSVPMFLYSSYDHYINWSSYRQHFGVLLIFMSFN